MLELTNENPREEDARIVRYAPEGSKELFSFDQGDTYLSQMREWAEIVRDSVRHGSAGPDAPTFADGLACSRVIDRLERRALAAGHRDEEPT